MMTVSKDERFRPQERLDASGLRIVECPCLLDELLPWHASGPLDIALFTVRQRRTDPAWMGRAFAVSMSINFLGFPIGSALTGWLATESIELAVLFAVAACFVAAVLARLLIPLRDDRAAHGRPPSSTG